MTALMIFQPIWLPEPVDRDDYYPMQLSKSMELNGSKELLSWRKRKIVHRYHKRNRYIHPEKYAH